MGGVSQSRGGGNCGMAGKSRAAAGGLVSQAGEWFSASRKSAGRRCRCGEYSSMAV